MAVDHRQHDRHFDDHANNGRERRRQTGSQEAQVVGHLVREIVDSDTTAVDREGQERAIALDDIVIITPYNAQVFEIPQCLPGARVGTVDKFKDQEAPIAVYSTATQSHSGCPARDGVPLQPSG